MSSFYFGGEAAVEMPVAEKSRTFGAIRPYSLAGSAAPSRAPYFQGGVTRAC